MALLCTNFKLVVEKFSLLSRPEIFVIGKVDSGTRPDRKPPAISRDSCAVAKIRLPSLVVQLSKCHQKNYSIKRFNKQQRALHSPRCLAFQGVKR